jgi:NCS1 family nucleobase:cation symporter-1
MIVDYWLIRKGNFHVPSLFTKEPSSPYTYYKGWNIRAIVAWLCGVAFTVHGVAGNLKPGSVNAASSNMYRLGFLLSLAMGSLVYYVACLIWPVQLYATSAEGPTSFEAMAASEGFFEGESPDTIRGVVIGSGHSGQDSEVGSNRKGVGSESVSEKYDV